MQPRTCLVSQLAHTLDPNMANNTAGMCWLPSPAPLCPPCSACPQTPGPHHAHQGPHQEDQEPEAAAAASTHKLVVSHSFVRCNMVRYLMCLCPSALYPYYHTGTALQTASTSPRLHFRLISQSNRHRGHGAWRWCKCATEDMLMPGVSQQQLHGCCYAAADCSVAPLWLVA
jgi:hypothetical protein